MGSVVPLFLFAFGVADVMLNVLLKKSSLSNHLLNFWKFAEL